MSAPSAFRIEQAMSVAQAARARLQDDPDLAADETAMRDLLDGESDVMDLLRRLARFALEAEAQAGAAKARVDNLRGRQKRFEARENHARQAIYGMMDALGLCTLPDPEFTLSIRAGTRAVFITDEAALPDEFVKVSRTPDKAAIAVALKADRAVPGAELSNSMPTLTLKAT